METRYVIVEKEAFTVMWACKMFSDYIMGLKTAIELDHKQLASLFDEEELDLMPLRIQRPFRDLMMFAYEMIFVQGKKIDNSKHTFKGLPTKQDGNPIGQQVHLELMHDECGRICRYCYEGWPQ
ncbi:hypothetical protein scyTo_0010345 [Scyliorhinus torazame]|uniref:Reverse transcriptase RNase H-like domain-containing protein n=1 Tax=Scyliorhinus torazame TaxID=75743 RepID=A0A401P4Q9_SCYTO|nr:hypothetical protein [Scyliorhinus torazame]